MSNIRQRLLADVDRRFVGEFDKKQTYIIQYLSALIFATCAMYLNGISYPLQQALLLLFATEASGQVFLAFDNQRSLKQRNFKILYFGKNILGLLAAISFSITALMRFFMASLYVDFSVWWILGTGIVLSSLFLLTYFFLSRRDEAAFAFVSFSAFVLAFFSLFLGTTVLDRVIGWSQLAYALILVTGVFFMKPKTAEILNILLWGLMFLGIMLFKS